MNILYMNQGGGGQWGAIKYSNYDLILLAESSVVKEGFSSVWQSKTLPEMSIQEKEGLRRRTITGVKDLDATAQQVRPMVTFATVDDTIRVVFVHLKSGNEAVATDALSSAIKQVQTVTNNNPQTPILWIGDFNRADETELVQQLNATSVFSGGGQAGWNLDRAYVTGDWSKYQLGVETPSVAGADHDHTAIAFNYEPASEASSKAAATPAGTGE